MPFDSLLQKSHIRAGEKSHEVQNIVMFLYIFWCYLVIIFVLIALLYVSLKLLKLCLYLFKAIDLRVLQGKSQEFFLNFTKSQVYFTQKLISFGLLFHLCLELHRTTQLRKGLQDLLHTPCVSVLRHTMPPPVILTNLIIKSQKFSFRSGDGQVFEAHLGLSVGFDEGEGVNEYGIGGDGVVDLVELVHFRLQQKSTLFFFAPAGLSCCQPFGWIGVGLFEIAEHVFYGRLERGDGLDIGLDRFIVAFHDGVKLLGKLGRFLELRTKGGDSG